MWSLLYIKLVFHQLIVHAPALYQLLVGALLGYAALVQHHYVVGVAHGAQPVGYEHYRLVVEYLLQVVDDGRLVIGVQ